MLELKEILSSDSTIEMLLMTRIIDVFFLEWKLQRLQELGYKLTKRGYFEAAESPSAINTAITLRNFLGIC